jgi:hypothetical protein
MVTGLERAEDASAADGGGGAGDTVLDDAISPIRNASAKALASSSSMDSMEIVENYVGG